MAYWKFDEGTGNIASDSSGRGNNAQLSNDPDCTSGRFGGGIHTNGTGLIRIKKASFDLSSDITVARTWFHLTLSKSASRAKIYINGAAVGSDLDVGNASGTDIGIGRYTFVDSRGCNCSFDEFWICNRTLSEREIAALFKDDGVPYMSGAGASAPQ
jgi:hypothetical protein